MIHVARLHEQFRNTVNRLNSAYNKTFSVAVIDSYLNRSQDVIIEFLMSYVEINTKARNHLRVLEKKEVSLPIIERLNDQIICSLPDDQYRLLRMNAFVSATCGETRKIGVRTIPSHKLNETLNDPYWKPSYDWCETIGDESSKGYHVFTEDDWNVEKVVVDYLRKPKMMAAHQLSGCSQGAPYIMADGTVVTDDMHCEFSDTYLWRYIGDMAAYFALRDLGQTDDANSKAQEMIFSKITQL